MQRDPDVPAGYYVPAPSRWPVIGAAALFLIGLGAALSVNALVPGYWTLAVGVAVLLWMLWGWFRDVIRESVRGSYARQEDQSFRWGMGWFIFSEIMFFGALFGALFYVRVIALPDLGGPGGAGLWDGFRPDWPAVTGPGDIQPYRPMAAWGLPAVNTLILLSSGLTLTLAHLALLAGRRRRVQWCLGATVLLGALFLGLQAWEYRHAMHEMGLSLASGAYGMTFYLLTGFHGLHVFLGALILSVVWLRLMRGHFDERHHFAFEAAAWYWHFVDVVWLVLFVCVYWL